MPYFKSWKEIAPTATDAEKDLKSALEEGEICELGPADKIPAEPNNWSKLDGARHIRADVLRFFLVHAKAGGLQPHERGLQLNGAYISGCLGLAYCTVPLRSALRGCRFQFEIFAEHSHWAFDVRLAHCAAPSFDGLGCKIGGQFDCAGAEFTATKRDALNLQGAEIKEDLFLRNAKITGTANLPGLKLGGQFDCAGAGFTTTKGDALNLQGAEIKEDLFLRELKSFTGILNLTDAKTSSLVEDANSIHMLTDMSLDGFTYDRIIGPTDSKTRLRWLERGDDMNGEFAPQPYKQLAKVLHDMGHEGDATTIRVALAKKLAAEARKSRKIELNGDWKPALLSIWYGFSHPFLWLWHFALSLLTDFGYRPAKSVAALIALWMVAVCPAHLAWEEGSFSPNSGPILTSPDWMWYAQIEENPADTWSKTLPGKDWETFNRYAYAADLVIPILELGQTDAWAPSTEREWWGKQLYWLRWVFTIAGWIVTALGAAALTGIIRRE